MQEGIYLKFEIEAGVAVEQLYIPEVQDYATLVSMIEFFQNSLREAGLTGYCCRMPVRSMSSFGLQHEFETLLVDAKKWAARSKQAAVIQASEDHEALVGCA